MTFYGAKRAKGVAETIIANIPYHVRYFEVFAQTQQHFWVMYLESGAWPNTAMIKYTYPSSYARQRLGEVRSRVYQAVMGFNYLLPSA